MSFEQALEAAHKSFDDGSIDEFETRRDEFGFRIILAHSDLGWYKWFSEADE